MSLELIILIAVIAVAVIVILAWLNSGAKFFERQSPDAKESAAPATEVLEGYRQVAAGNYEAGIELLKQAALDGYKDPLLYVTLMTLYRATGRSDKAVKLAESLLMRRGLNTGTVQVILKELINSYRISGGMPNAEDCLRNLETRKISLPEITLLQADLQMLNRQYEQAIKKYQKYEKETNEKMFREIADAHVRMAEDETGSSRTKHLLNALKADPESFEAALMLADIYFTENKAAQGLETLAKIVKAGIIMSKDSMQKVEDLYYKYASLADLYELMSRQTVAAVADPMPYLFLSAYYGKKSETEKAAAILKEYLTAQAPLAIVLKAYAHFTTDGILRRVVSTDKLYRCNRCLHELDDYSRICPKCGSLDSLKFK